MECRHESIQEPARTIPVRASVDVVVAGAGLGGIAAATAAARAGARVLLIERNQFVGGVATAGMCCSIFNCYFTARRELGINGISVEVADVLAEATGYGRRWRSHKGHVIYDIEKAKLVLADLVTGSGAELLVGTPVVDAVVSGARVGGVIVETKAGREAVLAHTVVDATGDADIAARAGAAVHTGSTGFRHSLCFRMGRVDTDRFVDYLREHPSEYAEHMDVDWTLKEALAQYDDCGTLLFPHGGGIQMAALKRAADAGRLPSEVGVHDSIDACQMHALRQTSMVHIITGFVTFDGLDASALSRSVEDGRRMAFVVADAFRHCVPGFETAFVAGVAANLGVRASRWAVGRTTFTRDMMAAGARCADSVGRGVAYRHERKNPGANAWSCQVMSDGVFDVPLGCLLPKGRDGLIMGAGRSIGAADPMILRVMALTMVVGQGAGTAAAVAARHGCPVCQVPVREVQDELVRQGVMVDDRSVGGSD